MTSRVLVENRRSIAADLVANGVSHRPFPGLDKLVKPVIDGWLEFTNLKPAEKDPWTLTNKNNPDDPEGVEGPDDGYLFRGNKEKRFDGVLYDRKEFFHYKPRFWELVREANKDAEKIVPSKAQKEWLKHVHRLHEAGTNHILQALRDLDQDLPGFNFHESGMRGKKLGLFTLRLICYVESSELGGEIAKTHTDRNAMTATLGESVPGLFFKLDDGRIIEHVRQPEHVAVFAGKKLAKQTNRYLGDLLHGVKAVPESLGQRRWSAIMFGHTDTFLTAEERTRNKY